jgi:hypothetical protein
MNKYLLPGIENIKNDYHGNNKLLILAEGFEKRSLSFISANDTYFKNIIICRYLPEKETKYSELKNKISELYARTDIYEITYNRFDPFSFELEFQEKFDKLDHFTDIVIDISVMSKYLIMQIICMLSHYTGSIKVIYTEPMSHAPLEEEYEKNKLFQTNATVLPSSGVHNVIRTPLLTSTIMQKSPILLVTFLSFNEELIKALLSEFSPMHLFLINSISLSNFWKKDALLQIHEKIRKDYIKDNPLDKNGELERRVSTIDYRETFELNASIYRDHCINNRIILSPTGTKMQALGCALIKLCCPDIHIEYPIPESFYIKGYSSSEIRRINQIVFNNMPDMIKEISEQYQLNG